jgi:DNA helicase IV
MRVLKRVTPTPEQLKIITIDPSGIILIRGAAGSGKTTTALLRLKHLTKYWSLHHRRVAGGENVRILVLTYNRTLRGYVEALAAEQVELDGVILEVRTFAGWARSLLGDPWINDNTSGMIGGLGQKLPLQRDFLINEVAYALGRFMPEDIEQYLDTLRVGRGVSPRVEKPLRHRIVEEVIRPYWGWKQRERIWDWNDLAVALARKKLSAYDVIIVDEAQDFSANQMRAVLNHLAPEHSLTLVLDAAQRIYPNAFRWREVNIAVTNTNTFRLAQNYRNTIEIAQFAAPLLAGLELTDDGTVPDFRATERHGPTPVVITGRYRDQLTFAIQYIRDNVDLENESVAFLHLKGHGWFDATRTALQEAGLPFAEITQNSEWPKGGENIALSTMHSAKGLEFDHVIIIGFNGELTPHGQEVGDDDLEKLRRLTAMAFGRARKSILLGYKPDDRSALINLLDPNSYSAIAV